MNKIKNAANLNNTQKVSLLRTLRNFVNKLYCDNHPEIEAFSFDLVSSKASCRDCNNKIDKNNIQVNNEEFVSTIIDKIIRKRRFCAILDIPLEMRIEQEQLKALSLKEIILFYKNFVKLNLNKTAILTTCFCKKCGDSFSLENVP